MTDAPQFDWNNAEALDGLDVQDKSHLVGVELGVFGCEFRTNKDGVSTAYIDVETRETGERFTITDSSTGIRAQLVAYLEARGLDYIIESGEYKTVAIHAPKGLRVSTYQVAVRRPDGSKHPTAKTDARTYYLTTSGRRVGQQQAAETAPKARTARTPKVQS